MDEPLADVMEMSEREVQEHIGKLTIAELSTLSLQLRLIRTMVLCERTRKRKASNRGGPAVQRKRMQVAEKMREIAASGRDPLSMASERCRQGYALRKSGMTYRAIGEAMGVSGTRARDYVVECERLMHKLM